MVFKLDPKRAKLEGESKRVNVLMLRIISGAEEN